MPTSLIGGERRVVVVGMWLLAALEGRRKKIYIN